METEWLIKAIEQKNPKVCVALAYSEVVHYESKPIPSVEYILDIGQIGVN